MTKKLFAPFLPPSPAACREATEPAPDPVAARARVLFVDDEPAICLLMEMVAESFPINLTVARSVGGARALIDGQTSAPFDIVILDVKLSNGRGVEIYREIFRRWPATKVVFMTGMDTEDIRAEVEAIGPARIHDKTRAMSPPFLTALFEHMGIKQHGTTPPFPP